ncbi:MAG: type II toxin-antitoxin system Phd/YefM family antitoxin [Candidatus Limnocylindria bacterium]
MKRVGVAELKNNLSRYLRAVEAGDEVEVTDRDRVIARIAPARAQEVVTIRPATRPFREVRDRIYPPANWPVDSLTLLREERSERVP